MTEPMAREDLDAALHAAATAGINPDLRWLRDVRDGKTLDILDWEFRTTYHKYRQQYLAGYVTVVPLPGSQRWSRWQLTEAGEQAIGGGHA